MRGSWLVGLWLVSGCFYATRDRVVVIHDGEVPAPDDAGSTAPGTVQPPDETAPPQQNCQPPAAPVATDADLDGDGLSDAQELELGTAPDNRDTDLDRLDDGVEFVLGTNPLSPDTDADDLFDDTEVAACTDPLNPDSDADGLTDGREYYTLGTDPLNPDSDGDGVNDLIEVRTGTDPRNGDTDGDGLDDRGEHSADTDPLNPDTDADGLSDGLELTVSANPLDPDTDADGLLDGEEYDLGTNPVLADSDLDGVDDGPELTLGTDPVNPDTDEDTLTDGYELMLGTNPLRVDTDKDGLDDPDEVDLGTDPTVADTDGDGVSDGDEVKNQSDALDPQDSRPRGSAGTAEWSVKYRQGVGCSTVGPAGALGLAPVLLVAGLARRRRRLSSLSAVIPLLAGGCVYQQTIQKSGTDYLPMVVDAEAWCHAEPGYGAIFSVSATVDDDDGLRDVKGVEANVYDEYGDRRHVARLPLDPTDDRAVWAADYEAGGGLDCQYNGYTVDFVAWDDIVYSDVLTVWAEALPTAD